MKPPTSVGIVPVSLLLDKSSATQFGTLATHVRYAPLSSMVRAGGDAGGDEGGGVGGGDTINAAPPPSVTSQSATRVALMSVFACLRSGLGGVRRSFSRAGEFLPATKGPANFSKASF